MTPLERIAGLWFALLDASARGAAALSSGSWRRRTVHLREDDARRIDVVDGAGSVTRLPEIDGTEPARVKRQFRRSRVALDLDPGRFLFRSIDVPARASEFVGAVVRSQIDRLTPWRPETVLFGWSAPVPQGSGGTLAVTVAATDPALVEPVLDRVERLGALEIEARVVPPRDVLPAGMAPAAPLVIARRSAAALAVPAWRRAIGGITAIVVAAVIASSLYGQIAAYRLGAEMEELARDTATKRARLARMLGEADPAAGSRLAVEKRRAEVPLATLTLEAVAKLLPDDSYVTSFDLTGTRLQLVGFTRDAPALIRLLGSSDLFAGANFFAPTTRLAGDAADRFSIEATVRPGAPAP